MKKLLMMMLVAVMWVGVIPTTYFAQENSVQDLDVYMDTSEYDELNEELEARGRELIENANPKCRYVNLLLPVTRLVQSDSRWSSVKLGTSSTTIGKSGCCLTSFTMIRNYISGTSDTPVNVNSKLGSYANPFDYGVAANKYGYSIVTAKYADAGISDSSAESIIIGALDKYNVPVLVGVKTASGNTHFVVASGYDCYYNVIIRDPASRNYTKLNQYFDEGYFVHRIYCFND